MPPRWRPIPCSRVTPHPTVAAVPGARQGYGGWAYCSCPWPGGVQGLPAIPSTTRYWCMAWRSAFWRSGLVRQRLHLPVTSLSHVRWHYGSIWRPHTRLSLRRRPDQTAQPPPVRPRIQSPFSRIKPRNGKTRFATSSPWYRRLWGGDSQWSWQAPCGRLDWELGRPRACCFWPGRDIWDAAGSPPAHSLVWQPRCPGIRSSQAPIPGHSGPISRPRIAIHFACCKSMRGRMGAVCHANLALLSWPPAAPRHRTLNASDSCNRCRWPCRLRIPEWFSATSKYQIRPPFDSSIVSILYLFSVSPLFFLLAAFLHWIVSLCHLISNNLRAQFQFEGPFYFTSLLVAVAHAAYRVAPWPCAPGCMFALCL